MWHDFQCLAGDRHNLTARSHPSLKISHLYLHDTLITGDIRASRTDQFNGEYCAANRSGRRRSADFKRITGAEQDLRDALDVFCEAEHGYSATLEAVTLHISYLSTYADIDGDGAGPEYP